MKHLLIILFFLPISLFSQIHHVKVGGTGDGSSWVNASGDLKQTLLNTASGDTVWIAEGIYFPSNCSNCLEADREETFLITNAVTILGGFPNTGEPTLNERDWESFPTVLSGGIGILNDSTDNSFHVVTVNHLSQNVIIDGLKIVKGNANGGTNTNGGGLICNTCTENDGLKMANCSFSNNSASGFGGAYFSGESNNYIDLNYCQFLNNTAESGGAVYTNAQNGSFQNCRFENNTAANGGAAFIKLDLEFKNCWFSNNTAENGGAIHYENSDINLLGCAFYQNSATSNGGAVYVPYFNDADKIYNCTFAENTADFGSAFYFGWIYGTRLDIYNSIFWGNNNRDIFVDNYEWADEDFTIFSLLDLTFIISDKIAYEEFCTLHYPFNLNCVVFNVTDPFVDLPNGNLEITFNSAARNNGGEEDDVINLGLDTDINGNTRIFETIDVGAYELHGTNPNPCSPSTTNIVYVNPLANGINDGSSWENAYTNLQEALDQVAVCTVDSIWVAEGVYLPSGCTNCDQGNQREYTFEIKDYWFCSNGVPFATIYGGFPSNGNPTMEDRDWENNLTIFSGNIGDPNSNTDNTYHILVSSGGLSLDGITIQDGNANGTQDNQKYGGAIYTNHGFNLTNCTLSNNHADENGGALYLTHDSIGTLNNCIIENNSAGKDGGAIYGFKINGDYTSFSNNSAGQDGGGFYSKRGEIKDCIFQNNTAIGNGGGFRIRHYDTHSSIKNSTFVNNAAGQDGGAGCFSGYSLGNIENSPILFDAGFTVDRCIFTNNTANDDGGAIYAGGRRSLKVSNSLFDQNTASNKGGAIHTSSSWPYYDPNPGSTVVIANTFVNNYADNGAVMWETGDNNTGIGGNILWNNQSPGNLIYHSLDDPEYDANVYNTIVDRENCNELGTQLTCGSNIFYNPSNPFVDFENGDYSLNDSTIAIGNGVGTSLDLTGYPRNLDNLSDMGAFEFRPCGDEEIFLKDQHDVDSFPINFSGLSIIQCDLIIMSIDENSKINNLDSLNGITSVKKNLYIINNEELESLTGLNNLTTIDGNFHFKYNNLTGLENLTTVYGDFYFEDNSIDSLTGLENLDTIHGSLTLWHNSFQNLGGLSSLNHIGKHFTIRDNWNLQNLGGLENLETIDSSLYITNDELINLNGLNSLTKIGGSLTIRYEENLQTLDGLNALTNIGGSFTIRSNYMLENLNGLENLDTIGGNLTISRNENLLNLDSLVGLKAVNGGNLTISRNDELLTLDGLSGLNAINGELTIEENDNLTSLAGLNNLDPSTVSSLILIENHNLTPCHEPFICNYLQTGNPILVEYNGTGCMNVQQVMLYCENDDQDNDGYPLEEDCDDTNPDINPGAMEIIYNGLNDDCDPLTLDDDLDQDGFPLSEDCDDENPDINPDAIEIPNNDIDEDCDDYSAQDADNDGFWDDVDCDDNNAEINPDAIEIIYNGLDDDCDPLTLDDDLDQDGFVLAEDCDDENASINPDATEIPNNGIDEDCDGEDLIVSNNEISREHLRIFPNPTTGQFTIILPPYLKADLEVKDNIGKTLKLEELKETNQIDLSAVPDGVYILIIKTKDNLIVEKVIKFNP